MYLEEVEFINWRNLEKVELSFPEKTLVLAGDNAQGKTNFLEALFLLARGTSPRRAKDEEMIRWGEEFSYLRAQIREENLHFTPGSGDKGGERVEKGWEKRNPKNFSSSRGLFPSRRKPWRSLKAERFSGRLFLLFIPLIINGSENMKNFSPVVIFFSGSALPGSLLKIYGENLINCGTKKVVETRIRYLHRFVPCFSEFLPGALGEDVSLPSVLSSSTYRWEEGVEEGLHRAKKRVREEEKKGE